MSLYRTTYPVISENQVTDHEFKLVTRLLFIICIRPASKFTENQKVLFLTSQLRRRNVLHKPDFGTFYKHIPCTTLKKQLMRKVLKSKTEN